MNRKIVMLGIAALILAMMFLPSVLSVTPEEAFRLGQQLLGGQQQPQESFWVRTAKLIAAPIIKLPPIAIAILSLILTIIIYATRKTKLLGWMWKTACIPFNLWSKIAPGEGPSWSGGPGLAKMIITWIIRIITLGAFTFMRITNTTEKGPYNSIKGPLVLVFVVLLGLIGSASTELTAFVLKQQAKAITDSISFIMRVSISIAIAFFQYIPGFGKLSIESFKFIEKEGGVKSDDKVKEAKEVADSPTADVVDDELIRRVKLRYPEIVPALDAYEAALKEKWYDVPDDHPFKLKQRLINIIYEIEEVSRMLGIPREVVEPIMKEYENRRLKRK